MQGLRHRDGPHRTASVPSLNPEAAQRDGATLPDAAPIDELTKRTLANLRSHWGLDPDITYLHHGSFGACPKAVLTELHRLQTELECEPAAFLIRKATERLAASRRALGAFVGCDPEDLAFVPNVTVAINSVLRSLPLRAGDELVCAGALTEQGICFSGRAVEHAD